jgi:hypothetical protein
MCRQVRNILVIAFMFGSGCVVEAQEPRVMFLPPTRYQCLRMMEFEKLDQANNKINVPMSTAGMQLYGDYAEVAGWLQGYFTGWNVWNTQSSGGNLTKETRATEWITWILSYCRNHPSSTLLEAANELANALMTKR